MNCPKIIIFYLKIAKHDGSQKGVMKSSHSLDFVRLGEDYPPRLLWLGTFPEVLPRIAGFQRSGGGEGRKSGGENLDAASQLLLDREQ